MEAENKNTFKFELVASILIGLATVFGAWVAFQSAIWAGIGTDKYNQGINDMVKANSKTIQGYQQYSLDMLSLMEFRKASGTNFTASDIKTKIMSPQLRRSINWSDEVNKRVMLEFQKVGQEANPNMSESQKSELYAKFMQSVENIKKDVTKEIYSGKETLEETENWEIQSPRTDINYEKSIFNQTDSLMKSTTVLTNDAQEASSIGDKYTLLTVVLTVVLFFGGMSTTIKKDSFRVGFLGAGALLLIISIIRVFMLPMTF